MSHISTTSSKRLHLYMVIKPERASNPFAVSLWATWPAESGPRIMAAPEASWHDFARRLENSGLLDSTSLGSVDAHVGRGEPTVHYVSCSLEDLQKIGLQDVPESDGKRLSELPGAFYQKLSGTPGPLSTDECQPRQSDYAASNSQIALLGVRVNNVSTNQAVSIIDFLIDQGGFHQIATANVDFLNKAAVDPELMEILHSCELVLADGMPLVWASRLMGTPLKERSNWSRPAATPFRTFRPEEAANLSSRCHRRLFKRRAPARVPRISRSCYLRAYVTSASFPGSNEEWRNTETDRRIQTRHTTCGIREP